MAYIQEVGNTTTTCTDVCNPGTKGHATLVQSGVKYKRINREPLDAESVFMTYSELERRLGPEAIGTLYDGMILSVTDDEDDSYNCAWLIRWQKPEEGVPENTYYATKIVDEDFVRDLIGWGHLE